MNCVQASYPHTHALQTATLQLYRVVLLLCSSVSSLSWLFLCGDACSNGLQGVKEHESNPDITPVK